MYGVPPRTTTIVESSLPKQIGAISDEFSTVELMGAECCIAERTLHDRKKISETRLQVVEKVFCV